ncbi:MAG: hypothetical protein KF752_02390 [Pirellulaceae bacterium]|nr:hypothetical protein [Pirellulaceae bacterium]
MNLQVTLDDLQCWLLAHGRAYLAEPELITRSRLSTAQRAVLTRQAELRWRSRHRFPHPDKWLWTDRSLAQASDWWSALCKADLFPPEEMILDGCCGAGADAMALASRGPVMAVDSDVFLAALTANNAGAQGRTVTAIAERLSVESLRGAQWLHVDPDRRPTGNKTLRADMFSPSLVDLLPLIQQTQGSLVKIAPATQLTGQLEEVVDNSSTRVWVGNHRECRQQWLLFGKLRERARLAEWTNAKPIEAGEERASHALASGAAEANVTQQLSTASTNHLVESPDQRRAAAIVVPASADRESYVTVVFWGREDTARVPVTEQIGAMVYDLHPSLHAAGLQAAWAAQHGLTAITSEQGYYTGDMRFSTPWAQGFEVLDTIAWDQRKLRSWLREHHIGPVEVKSRLLKLDASREQQKLQQPAGQSVTLLVTRLGSRTRAIIGRRLAD